MSPTKEKKKGVRREKVKIYKPPRFTTEELNEEISTFLTTHNPYMSENCVIFDRETRTFKHILDYRKPVLALKCLGSMRKKLSEGQGILFGKEEIAKQEEIIKLKCNLNSAASQIIFPDPWETGNPIDPSLFPVSKFKGTVSKVKITTAYENHEKKKNEKDQYDWIHDALKNILKYVGRKATWENKDTDRRCLRWCERIVDQNLSEAVLDYGYYDNPQDEFRPDLGSLLPLWNFSCPDTQGLPVTSIAWSFHFSDLFAVGFRNVKVEECDEDKLGMIRGDGCLCIYSLKSPNCPEKIVRCREAVQCLSFHPSCSHLLAVGCKGGTLNVYDLRRERNDPVETNKSTGMMIHHDTVSQLRWLTDELPQKFCSVSIDGKTLKWQIVLNDLFVFDDVTSVAVEDWPEEVPPRVIETESSSTAQQIDIQSKELRMPCVSMCINPHDRDLFIVGTEAGVIHKCSLGYKKQLESYVDHKDSVVRIHWNPYHQRVFLSCSDDMTIRIWDHSKRGSVFNFFIPNKVKDACWAPFSSTLFAAISGNAMVYVYDIAVDKKSAIGTHVAYTAKKFTDLTTVCFHPCKPVLVVGDEKGHVLSFKLSPNLRSSLKDFETLEKSKFIAGEVEKMEKLLASATGRIH